MGMTIPIIAMLALPDFGLPVADVASNILISKYHKSVFDSKKAEMLNAISQLKTESSKSLLYESLKSDEPVIRYAAAEGLLFQGRFDVKIGEVINEAIVKDKKWFHRPWESLDQILDADAHAAFSKSLVPLFTHDDQEVRESAMFNYVMHQCMHPDAYPVLLKALDGYSENRKEEYRQKLIISSVALHGRDAKSAVTLLEKYLMHPSPTLSASAVVAILSAEPSHADARSIWEERVKSNDYSKGIWYMLAFAEHRRTIMCLSSSLTLDLLWGLKQAQQHDMMLKALRAVPLESKHITEYVESRLRSDSLNVRVRALLYWHHYRYDDDARFLESAKLMCGVMEMQNGDELATFYAWSKRLPGGVIDYLKENYRKADFKLSPFLAVALMKANPQSEEYTKYLRYCLARNKQLSHSDEFTVRKNAIKAIMQAERYGRRFEADLLKILREEDEQGLLQPAARAIEILRNLPPKKS